MKLKNKIAVITGGSRGIGKTIAEFFVREGATVIILARDQKEIAMAVKEIGSGDRIIQGFRCDVSNRASVNNVFAAIQKKYSRIDILVNAAGIQQPIGPFLENDIDAWERAITINLFGTIYCTKAVLPCMVKQRGGSIINFSGGGATSSRPNFSAYAVSKTGVVKFTEVLADEVAKYNVRVNAIAPGAVNTAMINEILKAGAKSGKAEVIAAKKRLKEGGVPPEKAAALAVFLASTASKGLTGRLISAPWDNWESWTTKDIAAMKSSEQFKLRRK